MNLGSRPGQLGIDYGLFARFFILWLLVSTPCITFSQQPTPSAAEAKTENHSSQPGPAVASKRADAGYDAQIKRALAAYQKEQWASALRDFQLAHALLPTARTLRTIGMCYFNLGDFPHAVISLERALSMKERPLSAKQARQTSSLIDQAMGELTQVSVQIDGPFDTFLIDDADPQRAQSGRLLVAPGIHLLRVEGPNVQPVRHGFTGNPGQELSINLALTSVAATDQKAIPAPQNVAQNAVLTRASGQTEGSTSGNGLAVVGALSLSVGAASLVASGVVALIANGLRGDLSESCPAGQCPATVSATVEQKRSRYSTYRTVAAVGFYGGAAIAALGGTLILLDLNGQEENPTSDSATLTLSVGPGLLSLRGSL